MAEIRLKGIRKSYATTEVVHGVDLDIRDGEFLVLVGPSGCGKSTILRMIAGLERITAGDIAIDGKVVNGLEPKDRDIAMVFQNYALYPHMSVYRNMAYGLKVRRTPRAEIDERVRKAAEILGLEEYLERKPRALSGGQRQRVAMGRAIVRNPKVFLFDEPLSNLDAKLRGQMRVELKQLHARLGNTFVYVTHDQVEAMTLGQRIMALRDGKVEQIGTPHEIYNRPQSSFVAGFIGSPGMNLLRGRAEGRHVKVDGLTLTADRDPPQELTIGIRPRKVSVSNGQEPGSTSGTVELVEPLGGHTVVHCRMRSGDMLLLQVEPEMAIREGDDLPLCLPLEALHVFDATTGKRIDVDFTL